mmetsp:Transcript_71277/g.208950  ORF Transcript_71277/g.208950 Transcript_71277/m.208950 type:complete len:350 (-) Transcript_71277:233-1282(-)
MPRRRLPGHDRVRVRVPVEAHVPAREGDLHACVAPAHQASPVHLGLVPAGHEPRGQVDDVDALLSVAVRPVAEAQPVGVSLPLGHDKLVHRLQERRRKGERLLLVAAGVLEGARAEDQDGVWRAVDVDCLLLERQRLGVALLRGVQRHAGGLGPEEVHDLEDAAPPGAQEGAQDPVVCVLRWVLRLLFIGERQAHEPWCALVDRLADGVSAEGLDQRRECGNEVVALLQELILRTVRLLHVHPGDLAAVARAEVALLDLLREPLEPAGLCHGLHGLHGLVDVFHLLAHLHDAKALLEQAGSYLLSQQFLLKPRPHDDVEAIGVAAEAWPLQALWHLQALRLVLRLEAVY